MSFYKNNLTDKLTDLLDREKVNYKYIPSKDTVLSDEIVFWSGKRNGLTVEVCDEYMYGRNFFKVVRTGYRNNEPFVSAVYEGNSTKAVVSCVKRILKNFSEKRDFYLKNKIKK